ncbi:MAG: hypothetical protein ABI451_12720 [Dokdonella sp.]
MKTTQLALCITFSLYAASGVATTATVSRDASEVAASVSHPTVAAPDTGFAFTQSASNTITGGNSVSCNSGAPNFYHLENGYFRRFDLDGNFAATGLVNVTSVDFGVQKALAPSGSQTVTVKLYAVDNNSPNIWNVNIGSPLATATISVPNQSLSIVHVPISTYINSRQSDLVVEIFTPDGIGPKNSFLIGSNAEPSINPAEASSYLRAAGCGITDATTISSLTFPDVNIVMTVNAASLPVMLQKFSVD